MTIDEALQYARDAYDAQSEKNVAEVRAGLEAQGLPKDRIAAAEVAVRECRAGARVQFLEHARWAYFEMLEHQLSGPPRVVH